MAYNANILLGRILKVHGFDGTVTVKLEEIFINNVPGMESVFLEVEGKPVPFFISASESPGADLLRLKFKGYDSSERVNEFSGCRVFLTSGVNRKKKNTLTVNLSGFSIFLSDESLAGSVSEVLNNPGQKLLKVKTPKGNELLIPLHEDLIIAVDKKKKMIIMDLPEGLTEINQK